MLAALPTLILADPGQFSCLYPPTLPLCLCCICMQLVQLVDTSGCMVMQEAMLALGYPIMPSWEQAFEEHGRREEGIVSLESPREEDIWSEETSPRSTRPSGEMDVNPTLQHALPRDGLFVGLGVAACVFIYVDLRCCFGEGGSRV
eukprot:1141689-Pelagomonas_calceolata.AAC.3